MRDRNHAKYEAGCILLIEDEVTSREICRLVLEGAGYQVEVADSAETAHECLNATRYGLVIADWRLPDGDGIYLADRALRLGTGTIIMTGHISDLPPGTGSRHHLLTKPFTPTRLIAMVRAVIGEPP